MQTKPTKIRGGTPRRMRKTGRTGNANDTTADPQTAAAKSKKIQVAALGKLPTKTWCLYPRLYNDTKEAELGYA